MSPLPSRKHGRPFLVIWLLALPAVGQTLSYDAFCDAGGNIATSEHATALWTTVLKAGRLEDLHADALKGNARAKRVFQELETSYFPDIGREVADMVNRPPCLVPLVREMSGWCVPNWSFLDFLSRDKPGGMTLRKALLDGFTERARERHLENQLILSSAGALLGTGVATGALREVQAATRSQVGRGGAKLKPDPSALGPHTTFKLDPRTGKVSSHAEWDASSNPVKRTDVTGKGHGSAAGPHTHEYGPPNVNPETGRPHPGNEVRVRPATPDELPK